jgi:hypothetical protein
MKLFETLHSFDHPWPAVTLANWNKYPNPYSSHVLSCDTLDRRVDPRTGVITTERLLCCKQPVPSILKRLGLDFQVEAFFHEISTLNPKTQEFTAQTVNLTMRGLLNVSETCSLSVHPELPSNTLFKQQAQVSAMGVFAAVGRLVEDIAVSRFTANAAKGRDALESVTQEFFQETLPEFLELNKAVVSESIEHSIDSLKNSINFRGLDPFSQMRL